MRTECIDHGKTSGCSKEGYYKKSYKGKMQLLHRLVYCKHNKLLLEDIKGLVIRHTCDNPRCVNPNHLLIGTQADNIRDMDTRGRRKNVTKRPWQSKLTAEQIKWFIDHYVPRHPDFGQAAIAKKFGVTQTCLSWHLKKVNT